MPSTADAASIGARIPVSLYVHFPWCLHKCPYCDFNSHALVGAAPEDAWLHALSLDLAADVALLDGRQLDTIFIGGGTPSLMSPQTMRSLLDIIATGCRLTKDVEISMEANPGSLERGRLRDYVRAGVNRISLGVQSFQDDILSRIGRIHNGREARAAIVAASAAGFRSCNVDLMYGLPGQTPARAVSDLDTALGLGATHVSWYQLTIEPNTVFHSRPPPLPDENAIVAIESEGRALLASAGLRRYEISAFSVPGHECRHNLNYWRFGDYLGIGPGAHGKCTQSTSGTVLRQWKSRRPNHYLARALRSNPDFIAGRREPAGTWLALEFLMNALRLTAGTSEELFEAHTGLPLDLLDPWRQTNVRLGLLRAGKDLVATEQGLNFLDGLLAAFPVAEQDPRMMEKEQEGIQKSKKQETGT